MATAPKVTKPVEAKEEKALTTEEINAIAGGLKPGEVGWVKLDDEGKPSGAASKEAPKAGDSGAYARVIGARPAKAEEATTPSGAPITAHMNPEPHLWDEGMLARNPVPGSPQASTVPPPAGAYLGKSDPIGHQSATPAKK